MTPKKIRTRIRPIKAAAAVTSTNANVPSQANSAMSNRLQNEAQLAILYIDPDLLEPANWKLRKRTDRQLNQPTRNMRCTICNPELLTSDPAEAPALISSIGEQQGPFSQPGPKNQKCDERPAVRTRLGT